MRVPALPVAALTAAADHEIANILRACAGPPAKGEVATVADLVLLGTPAIAAAWKPLLTASACSLSMTGVFCHGSPYVTFAAGTPPASCELADLLIVMDCVTGTVTERQAVLVQAKMAKSGGISLRPAGGDAKQLHLARRWPCFTFNSTAYDHRRKRDFNGAIAAPALAIHAGRYGGIDLSPGAEQWFQLDPGLATPFPLANGIGLGDFMARQANGETGMGVAAVHYPGPPPTAADDWSFTIAELLDVTYHLTHAAMQRPGLAPVNRGQTANAYLMCAEQRGEGWHVMALDQPPHGGGGGSPQSRRPHDGISFIHGILERG